MSQERNELLSDKVAQLEVSMQRLVEHIAEVTKQRDELKRCAQSVTFHYVKCGSGRFADAMAMLDAMNELKEAIANATKP